MRPIVAVAIFVSISACEFESEIAARAMMSAEFSCDLAENLDGVVEELQQLSLANSLDLEYETDGIANDSFVVVIKAPEGRYIVTSPFGMISLAYYDRICPMAEKECTPPEVARQRMRRIGERIETSCNESIDAD